ncbi:MAG: MerR family transcriptional regulator [Actinomycetales bacterium]|nr:MerR family transcriptional regulator [Actinomycetales bacterium]
MTHHAGPVVEQHPGGSPPLTVAGAARRLGVAPATLRTWDRRYGLGPSARSQGGHRRYTPDDVALLVRMQRLLSTGVPVAEAAARVGGTRALPPGPGSPATVPSQGPPQVGVVADAAAAVRGCARAAATQDAAGLRSLLDELLAAQGVVWTWECVLVPVLVDIGRRWEQTGQGIEVEHLLSDMAAAAFRRVTDRAVSPVNELPVVLASAPDDLHSLPLQVIAAALAEQGIASLILGARVTVPALCATVTRVGPPAVLIWAQLPRDLPAGMASLRSGRTRPLILLAGPGWPADSAADWPRPATLTSTVALIRARIAD